MKKEMLINVLQPEECRIAIVEDGILEELYVERTSQESYVGNIYKGRIVNIEPSIQAAFVDFGIGRNGFLHVSDVEPAYYRHLEQRRGDGNNRRGGRRRSQLRPSAAPAAEELERDLAESEAESEGPAAQVDNVVEQPSTAEHEPQRSDATPKERSRSRGRSRRPGPQREVEARPAPAELETPPDAGPLAQEPGTEASAEQSAEEKKPPRTEEPTRFMESAERRTEESSPADEGLKTSSGFSDEDLFFPRAEPAQEKSTASISTPPHEPAEEQKEPAPAASKTDLEEEAEWHFAREPQTEERHAEEGETAADYSEPELPFACETEPEEEPVPRTRERVASADLEEPELAEFEEEYEHRRRRGPRDERRGRPHRRISGRPGSGRPKPLIQEIFKRGQEVLVQVIKEGIGTKGPTLSTYISIAGRYLVLMPGLNRVGVSRKIADDDARHRLREIFHELQPPKGLGFIIRTAGIDKTKKELQRDLAYLSRLWQVVVRRIRKLKAPAEIYQESDMITRTIRDTFTSDIDTIWVDEPTAFEHAQEFLQIVMPRYASRIKLYSGSEPLFYKYGIEEEIARIQQRHVPLPNGGSIVIEQTEALVAIDVNSGNFRADNNAEETAYQMNLLAAKEIARQLRLRDLGGVIVNDFIDMREEKHRRNVERGMRDAVKRDRARTKILKISQFGLIEMTRQRIRPSLKRSVYQDCPHCHGTGQVKTCESMSIDVMRMLQLAAHRQDIHRIEARVHEDVANYLLNKKRKEITRLEESGSLQVAINAAIGVSPETLELVYYDNNNTPHKFTPYDEHRRRPERMTR
jgi:ribonuclease E